MRNLKIMLCIVTALAVLGFAGVQFYTYVYSDTVPPVITMDSDLVSVSVRDKDQNAALLAGVSASDNHDGDLTGEVMVSSVSQLIGVNTAKVNYTVFDGADNMATASRMVCYTDYTSPHFVLREPLVYGVGEVVALMGRVEAYDVRQGDITDMIRLSALSINNNVEGIYHVSLRATNDIGDDSVVTLPVIIRNQMPQSPEIILNEYLVYITVGSNFNVTNYFESINRGGTGGQGNYGDLSVDNGVDVDKPGIYEVHYSYTNVYGYTADAILTVVVEESEVVAEDAETAPEGSEVVA